jgi:hypothetical protein
VDTSPVLEVTALKKVVFPVFVFPIIPIRIIVELPNLLLSSDIRANLPNTVGIPPGFLLLQNCLRGAIVYSGTISIPAMSR